MSKLIVSKIWSNVVKHKFKNYFQGYLNNFNLIFLMIPNKNK